MAFQIERPSNLTAYAGTVTRNGISDWCTDSKLFQQCSHVGCRADGSAADGGTDDPGESG